MPRNRMTVPLFVWIITSLILAACGSQAPQTPQAATTPTTETSASHGAETSAAPSAAPSAEPTTAASPDSSPTTETSTDGTYRVGIFSDLSTINFWSYFGPNSSVWNSYVLQPQRAFLYGLSDKKFDVIPSLAKEMPERPLQREGDFYVATIEMKSDVMWSDGTPITANDYAFTANTSLELQLPGNWTSSYDPNYLDHVEAVDNDTVKLFYKQDPGIAVHEWGALQGPILSEAYWTPVVDQAKEAVGALTPPAQDAPQADQDAYQEKLTEALNVLYNHTPEDEPVAGAFTLGRWEQGAFVENSANPTYYQTGAQVEVYANGAYHEVKQGDGGYEITVGTPEGEKVAEYTVGPHISSVVYTVYGSQDAAILALKNGDIDFILNSLGLQRGLQAQIEGQAGIEVVRNPINGYRYLGFNTRKAPMSDTAFRQAVATLIDKQFVTDQILQGAAFPVETFIAEGNTVWYSGDVPKWGVKDDGTPMTREERVNKAVELLTAAGFSWEGGKQPTYDATSQQAVGSGRLLMPDGQPVPNLELLGPVPSYDPLRSTFAIWIERWLNEIGIPVKANLKDFNVYRNQVVNEQNFDMYILGWSLDIFPGSLYSFFHSRNSAPGDYNSGGFSNPEFDKASEELLSCTSVEQCKEIANNLQQILSTELPYVILFETGIIEAYRSDTLEYPYTDTLSGLQYIYGLPATVKVSE